MSTYNIQFHEKIRKILNICFLELLEGFRIETEKQVRIIQGKRAIRFRAIEVILYVIIWILFLARATKSLSQDK